MRFRVVVGVRLKEGLLDPEGKAVESALPSLGWQNVSRVRFGKEIDLEIEAGSEESALQQTGEMCLRLLSNPVIEDYRIVSVEPANASVREGA